MSELKICPRCSADFSDWPDGDDEGVDGWDGRTYCSGECVVAAFRDAPKAEKDAWRESVRQQHADDELPDDAAQKQATLAELVAYRLTVIGEVTGMLRALPRYDRDHPAAVRVARRIEEWASQ